ncbi:MAG TPA: pyruvate kinase [Candidatus Limicola stercorigallinarum]|nr:pyruvate kinase [Candidatus Limicola stercorigallinarum]
MSKRTKIVCTMGPACDDEETLRQMILAGMNVARFNFSHGSHEEHHVRMERVKRVSHELGIPVGILLDTKGPEIRTGFLEGHAKVTLEPGAKVIVTAAETSEERLGTSERFYLDHLELPREVHVGGTILIDDGLIGLTVDSVDGQDIHCTVQNGGELGEKKGVNVPNAHLSLPAITEQDRADILFGLEEGIDFIAASFIRDPEGVLEIRQLCDENGGEHVCIFPKIECATAVYHFDNILAVSDGIMIARGDLGVEVAPEVCPTIQKEIIQKCNAAYKPVITATQMLDSMIRNPRPTRAEVTDVANAITDGTDATMLSGETAAGKYPLRAVQMMANVALIAEAIMPEHARLDIHTDEKGANVINNAVGLAAVTTAYSVGARAILTPTSSGRSARLVSNFRPSLPIQAVTHNDWAQRRMTVYWGVDPVLDDFSSKWVTPTVENAVAVAERTGVIKEGDIAVITVGDPRTSVLLPDGLYSTNVVFVSEVRPEGKVARPTY